MTNRVEITIQELALLLSTLCINSCVCTVSPSHGRESIGTMASNARKSIDTMASNYLADADGELDR